MCYFGDQEIFLIITITLKKVELPSIFVKAVIFYSDFLFFSKYFLGSLHICELMNL